MQFLREENKNKHYHDKYYEDFRAVKLILDLWDMKCQKLKMNQSKPPGYIGPRSQSQVVGPLGGDYMASTDRYQEKIPSAFLQSPLEDPCGLGGFK